MNLKTLAVSLMLSLGPACLFAQETQPAAFVLKYGAKHIGKSPNPSMKHYRDNRLGAFIHWGLYSIPGGTWNGQNYHCAAEWMPNLIGVPTKDWMALMKQWNPQNFDAKAWAHQLKEMGVRYVKITTKHHEGFCLWPSKYSKYTVAHTPYKKDILDQIIKAFKDEGIDVHFYFSIMEWYNPDYRSEIKTPEDSVAFERFKKHTEDQLRELIKRYPSVHDYWFDGTWDKSIISDPAWTSHIEEMMRELVPGVTINSRLRADDYGHLDIDSNGNPMGDYESGYERRLPDPVEDLKVTKWDWEACMTIPENQWGYHKDWSWTYVKTPIEVIQRIVHAVSMGGNMVVNFGPQPDGDFRPEEKNMMKTVGEWMKRNGECVYGCDYAGLKKQDWGYFTQHGDTTYMVVFNEPFSGGLIVNVNDGDEVKGATTIDGTPLKVVETTKNEYRVSTPATSPKEPYVIRLQIFRKDGKGNTYKEALT